MGRYQIYLDKAYDAIERRAYNEAIQWCKKAIDVDGSAPEAHHARGEALDASGMWEEALQAFDRALERDPEFVDALLSKAEILADSPDRGEEALPLCARAESVLATLDEDQYLLAESFFIRGKALHTLDRLDEALEEYEKALALVPDQPEYLVEKGILLFSLIDYEGAEEVLRLALKTDPDNPDVQYTLGLVFEKTGHEAEALEAFAAAHRLEPTRHPPILRVARERFEAEVEKALAAIPAELGKHLENVVVTVEDTPARDWLTESGHDPQILGVFEGPTQNQQANGVPAMPARITLFQRNLEKMCETEENLMDEIRVTVMHEVGHYFGMSEDDLRALGLD